jgi:hypothetical protein
VTPRRAASSPGEPDPLVVPAQRGRAALWTLSASTFIALVSYLYSKDPDQVRWTFWIFVPIASLALLTHLMRLVSSRPEIVMDAAGLYMMPPGARIAWADVAALRSDTHRLRFFLPKRTYVGVVPRRNGALAWDHPWSPARLFVGWSVLRRQPPMSIMVEPKPDEIASIVSLMRRYAGHPIPFQEE